MTKNISIFAIIGLLYCLFEPSLGAEKQTQQPETVTAKQDYACGAITNNSKLIRDDKLQNQTYALYRYDDTKREKPIDTLEVREGRGYLQKLKIMTLSEAEQVWGKSRDNIINVSPTLPDGMVEPDRKIFDLVAIGTNRHPMFFYIVARFEDGRISEYTIDGPGIRRLDPKQI